MEKNINNEHPVIKAAKATDIETFMKILCPIEWHPIIARIIESGVKFDSGLCKWLIGWSDIPNTKKTGIDDLDSALKTCMFKMHDCFHQLWGIPIPSIEFSEEEFYVSKRAQMCGEVSVLTMTEFMFAKHLWDTYPELRTYLESRNSLRMMHGVLKGKTPVEIAMRLDDILHKNRRPKWLRDNEASTAFADDYVPMLQRDRDNIDHNWEIMKLAKWIPTNAPNIRYSPNVDGLELTIWMITDFYHLLKTDDKVDYALAEFNHQRRQSIIIPEGWWH
jgi:hypothetical protein